MELNSECSCWFCPWNNGKGLRFRGIESGPRGLFVTADGLDDDGEIFRSGYKNRYVVSIGDRWNAARTVTYFDAW
jgi:hypothetical protein